MLTEEKFSSFGDFYCRTGHNPDYIINDSTDLNDIGCKNLLPQNYSIDEIPKRRNNQDNICSAQGLNLLDLCISSQLRILNGRYVGDSLGYFTCLTVNGLSSVDYAIAVKAFCPQFYIFLHKKLITCQIICRSNYFRNVNCKRMLHQNPFFQVGQILSIIDGQKDQKRK